MIETRCTRMSAGVVNSCVVCAEGEERTSEGQSRFSITETLNHFQVAHFCNNELKYTKSDHYNKIDQTLHF